MENLLGNLSSSTEPVLQPSASAAGNCSTWDRRWGAPYLQRLAHLDVQLYQDFYAVWVSLMVRKNADVKQKQRRI